jgi:hypothetical protein
MASTFILSILNPQFSIHFLLRFVRPVPAIA